jgi:hypothetical protein
MPGRQGIRGGTVSPSRAKPGLVGKGARPTANVTEDDIRRVSGG